MSLAKPIKLKTWLFLFLVCSDSRWLVTAVAAQDHRIDRLGGSSWSPNGEWLALNWPERPDLFIISLKTGKSFTLRPAGDVDLSLETGQIFAARPQPGSSDASHTWFVASPGRGPLSLLEWSPDGAKCAYQTGGPTNALFSVTEGTVARRMAMSEIFPWHKPDELHVTFELVVPRQDRPEQYWLRVAKSDGTVLKQIVFEDPRVIRRLAAIRHHDISFLSTSCQFVLYPRLTGSGWQILSESLAAGAAPQAITQPGPREPYQWQLSSDDRFLALVEGDALIVGALDDWPHARTISLPHDSVTISWSPDGRFLALLDGHSLSVVAPLRAGQARDGDHPELVTDNCSPRFWGWRGSRLFFGDPRTDLTNLSCVDAEHLGPPTQVTRARDWETATRDVRLSPDGQRLTCLVAEIDYAGRAVWKLWQSAVQTNAQWRLMYALSPQ